MNISQEILPDITFTASITASSYITCCWQTPSMRFSGNDVNLLLYTAMLFCICYQLLWFMNCFPENFQLIYLSVASNVDPLWLQVQCCLLDTCCFWFGVFLFVWLLFCCLGFLFKWTVKQLKEKLKSLFGETAARIPLKCSERYRRQFLQTYQSASKLPSEGLEAGDGWLGIRWKLLSRAG